MTYYGANELADSFRTVRRNTIAIAEEIPEDEYDFRPAPGCRSVAQVLSHVATTTRRYYQLHAVDRITTFEGIDFLALTERWAGEEAKLTRRPQILDVLKAEGERWAIFLESLSEDDLGRRVAFPQGFAPPSKSRFELLLAVKEHEMHHRGQLMVVQRLLGLVPHLTREREARVADARSKRA